METIVQHISNMMPRNERNIRREVRIKLTAASVSSFYEAFDGGNLGVTLDTMLTLVLEEYEREPGKLSDILDRIYERLQT